MAVDVGEGERGRSIVNLLAEMAVMLGAPEMMRLSQSSGNSLASELPISNSTASLQLRPWLSRATAAGGEAERARAEDRGVCAGLRNG